MSEKQNALEPITVEQPLKIERPNVRLSVTVSETGQYASGAVSWSPRDGEQYRRGLDLPDGRPNDVRAALHRALDMILDTGGLTDEQRGEVYSLVIEHDDR
jgi:hypothetical protein